jgi:signal peptidase I
VKDKKAATRTGKKLAAQKKSTLQQSTLQQRVRREIAAWFWVGLVFLLVNGAVGQARVIPSGSMQNTLLVGDHLIMSRVGYDAGIPFTNLHVPLWRTPKRQQIVIFRPVIRGEQSDVIKRVIGLPGETVDVHNGGVWINGSRLQENYAVGRTEPADPSQYLAGFEGQSKVFPYRVPRDCFFVMGDNRENSLDSRYTGCIPRGNIVGTPVMIYMSIDAPSGPWSSGEITERALTYLNAAIHPGEVRWRRLFRIF